ncbi:MAG: endonuclease/exonuclease/phosphatase family protein [Clostridia bacterium]|nr:endonuclease/exonuclease/phosphatase family protein [Clostridia bacterium]
MGKLKIVTFNIRAPYDAVDGINAFVHRAGLILETIDEEKPDIICFQEMSAKIRPFLKKFLTDYDLVGHGRLADYSDEGLGIAYRKDCLELFGLEQFWLSPTPCIPGSRYEIQSEYPRICVYATLKHKDIKTPIRIYNVHLDHKKDEAKVSGIKLVLEKIEKDNSVMSYPTLLMGDFNAEPDSTPIALCNENKSFPLIDLTKDTGSTFHDYNGTGLAPHARGKKIDYIFADTKTYKTAKQMYKWEHTKNGIHLSDHYPVCVELEYEDMN